MDTIIKVPRVPNAKMMLWTDVSYHNMEEIDNKQSITDLESVLCSVFGVDLAEPKRGVLLELYVQTVLFCRERSFKKEQTSALLSIVKSIHEANIETPLDNIEQCFEYCKELILCHSVRRPPFSIDLFNSEEANCIFKYIHNSYMRHYKLYKYIFTPQVKLDLTLTYSRIPDHEDSSAPETAQQNDEFPETHEHTSIIDREESALGPTADLKALIEKGVTEQMMHLSGQLDERMKEIADQHNSSLNSPQTNLKDKK
ncbi:putative coiled-coil domain-containing protein C16orf93 -like isoform 4 [Scophthalmus maximus]|uniref:Putative coiled-coil domain-containing protein C16orf93-like isoform 4 n=1 Tax=Scophthalmus maximus TaxID=52904 RepID=A0A2U9CLM5_SCOMX|nr:coiled-coil domain-containing protein 189 isoform X2 [Scophthalmus maximus]AWP17524.1 putative coiled-coil domain-containing protein C16orf93 -like isoform 4 [Scophthalmus maximus]